MSNEAARAEIERAIKRTDTKIENHRDHLDELAHRSSDVKAEIRRLDDHQKELLKSLDELGGPLPKKPEYAAKKGDDKGTPEKD